MAFRYRDTYDCAYKDFICGRTRQVKRKTAFPTLLEISIRKGLQLSYVVDFIDQNGNKQRVKLLGVD